MHTITGYTLVDITGTGAISADTRSRNQQRNWETLKQVLGLRTQVEVAPAPSVTEQKLTNLHFGAMFKGKHLVWQFKFQVEQITALGEEFSGLKADFEIVPVTLGLAETVKIPVPLFDAVGSANRNIYFEIQE